MEEFHHIRMKLIEVLRLSACLLRIDVYDLAVVANSATGPWPVAEKRRTGAHYPNRRRFFVSAYLCHCCCARDTFGCARSSSPVGQPAYIIQGAALLLRD